MTRAVPTTTCSTGRPATAPPAATRSTAAEIVVEQQMTFPRSHPAPMETCGAIADFDRVSGKLTIHCTTQAPHAHRTLYAAITGLPEHRIRVVSPDIGGGFGNKVPVYPGYVCAAAASMLLHRPVKWVEDRSESLMASTFARDYEMTGRIAATAGRPNPGDLGRRPGRPRRVQRGRAAEPLSGGLLQRVHRLLRPRGRSLSRARRVHEQGARRGRLRVLVSNRRGRLPGRAARRPAGPAGRGRSRAAARSTT